jgi:hypothetical protein
MNHSDYESMLAAYVLGALEAGERAQMEEHLRLGCPLCVQSLEGYRLVAAALPLSVPVREAGPEVKAALMERIVAPGKARRRLWLWPTLAPLLSGCLAACAILFWSSIPMRRPLSPVAPAMNLVLLSGRLSQAGHMATLGASLAWNAPLEADAGSDAEVQVGSQDVLLVAAGSELRLTHDGKRVLAELPHGTVFSAVYPGTAFGVQAGRARVDAHGTLFVVHRGAGDRDYVCICQGRIRIRAPGLDRELAAANYGMKIGLNLRLGASDTVASAAQPEFYTEAEAIDLTHALQKAAMAARASQGQ